MSSGRTDRHRLHRGGDRQANSALWRIARVRMGCYQETRDYVARRTAEGKTKTEIMRCLERYIAREIFPHLLTAAPPTSRPDQNLAGLGRSRKNTCSGSTSPRPVSTGSVEAELVALDVLHHEARLVVVIGGQQSHAYCAQGDQPCAFGLQGG